MPGMIAESDIAAIKQRVNIVDVVGDYVTLKKAGVDSLKGLCPFHDERTPSFNVRPNIGRYHCFGCQESGDAISFLMNYEHLSFVEALEQLAARVNYTITYEDTGNNRQQGIAKTRLYAAHKAAADFYSAQLDTGQGRIAVEFLAARGFDTAALQRFGVGYSPDEWSALSGHLLNLGFTAEELLAGGLVSTKNRGVYDRFRGRIMWPIRDITGQTVGFGARKLLESDTGPKYLNSPESPIYHKAQVLYGIDLAKKTIAKTKKAVIVEGYTDVMACHLAGVTAAVATCGTAFGADHISVLRRVLGDDNTAEVIFTFDPDSAGQAAALKAYSEESRFNAQTYVAGNIHGLDPSDLRQHHGDAAVAEMFNQKSPLFEFALRQAVAGYDLNSVAGRYSALQSAAPIVQRIRDVTLRGGYARELALMLGVEVAEVNEQLRRVTVSSKAPRQQGAQPVSGANTARVGGARPAAIAAVSGNSAAAGQSDMPAAGADDKPGAPPFRVAMMPRTREARLERDALVAIIQYPHHIGEQLLGQAVEVEFGNYPFQQIRDAIASCLPAPADAADLPEWLERVVAATPERAQMLARELAFLPLPQNSADGVPHYCRQITRELLRHDLEVTQLQLRAQLRVLGDAGGAEMARIQRYLLRIEQEKRKLRMDGEHD